MTSRLVTLEDSVIKTMMQDPRITELLPCLRSAQQELASIQKGGRNCTRCNKQKATIAKSAMAKAAGCIRGAKGAKLQQLKKILNAKQLRIIARNGRGVPTTYTF